jgi:broad specificity phosphatase PhoE
MKTIYFLRHGECESNVRNAPYKGKNAKLTAKGVQDTQKLTLCLQNIKFDSIISSSSSRAKDTAEIVNRDRGLSVKITELFVEREHPSELLGVTHEDERFGQVKQKVKASFRKHERYSDEETFADLSNRAKKFKSILESEDGGTILVVGHGKFTKFFLSYLCFGNDLNTDIFIHLDEFMTSRNLGLSEATYDEKSNRWRLQQWNANLRIGL